jgi:hypothetical protein
MKETNARVIQKGGAIVGFFVSSFFAVISILVSP